jgi:hypothetical protein
VAFKDPKSITDAGVELAADDVAGKVLADGAVSDGRGTARTGA